MQRFNDIQDCGKQLGFEFQPGIYHTDKYGCALFTMGIYNCKDVSLTIGARWEDRSNHMFTKDSLQDMINDLQFICDNMEAS